MVSEDEIGQESHCGVNKMFGFENASAGEVFLMVCPGDTWKQWFHMKDQVDKVINLGWTALQQCTIQPPTNPELLKFFAYIILATQYAEHSINLFGGKDKTRRKKKKSYLQNAPDFSSLMSFNYFCEIKLLVLLIMEGENTGKDNR